MKDEHKTKEQLINELAELHQRIAELERSETQRKRVEWALGERVKELTCLYAVNRDMQEQLSTDELCRRVIEHLVPSMQFPEITVPVIELDGRRFTSERYTEGLSHGLCAQITVGGEARGHLWVYYAEDRPFLIPEEQNLLNAIVEALGLWLERKRAEEALRESKELLEKTFTSQRDAIFMLDAKIPPTIIHCNPATTEIFGYTRQEMLGRTTAFLHVDETALRKFQGHLYPTIEERGFLHLPDFEMRQKDGTIFPTEHSVMPLEDEQGKRIGWVSVVRDITERKRAEEALRQRTAQLEALRQVGLQLTAQLDLDALLRSIVRRAIELLGGTSGGLYLYRPEQDVLEWAVTIGPDLTPTGTVLHRDEGLAGRVWETGEPLIVDDYQRWEGRPTFHEAYPWTAVVGVPVRWGEELLGVLNVNTYPTGTFSPADAELLSLFATQAAIAIRNARLFQTEQEQRELTERLRDTALLVNSSLELQEVLELILDQLARVVPYDGGTIQTLEPGATRVIAIRNLPREELGRRFPLDQYPYNRRLAQGEGPIVIRDVREDSQGFVILDSVKHVRANIGVPLWVRDRVIGIFTIDSHQPGAYTEADAQVAQAFAQQAAIAIENARLYEQAQQDAKAKSTLLREVNHRVKNNLVTIVSLLYAERRRPEMEDQAVSQSIIQTLVNRVQSLTRVHSLLSASEWAPLPLSELTTQVINSSLQMLPPGKRVSVDVPPSPVRVTSDQAHNLALVINELATNTAKHALQERNTAQITVRIALDDDTVLFEYRDDGPGYPEEALQLEHHNVGFDLMQKMVGESLGGELSLHNDHGAVAIIRFKAKA